MATAFCAGHTHDFALFKRSRLWLSRTCRCIGDSGYLGLNRWHDNSQVPHKKSKHHPLTPEQKTQNRRLSSERIVVEHALRRLKVFRILSERYRNRRKRFGLRFNLLAAISNHQLQFKR
jgi:transposase